MRMKLMVCVRPGVELTCASFCPSRELIKLDFPTLDRPRKANSGGPSAGKNLGSAADVRNLARMGFMQVTNSLTIAGVRRRSADECRCKSDNFRRVEEARVVLRA